MRYLSQKDDYSCVPTSCKMILDHIDPNNDISFKKLFELFETDSHGTYSHDARRELRKLGYKVRKINKKKITEYLDAGNLLWVSYKCSKTSGHSSVIVRYEIKMKEPILYLYDPFFGKNFKLSEGILDQLKPKYFVIER